MHPSDVRVLPAPASRLGEAPVWCPERQTLTWVDIWGRRLYTWHERDGLVGAACLDELPGGLALAESGLVVAHATGIELLSEEDGWVPFAHPERDRPGGRYNDAALDPRGRLWVGSVESGPGAADGSIYRVDPDGTWTTLLTGLAVPNGIDFSPDGSVMYVTVTERNEILRYDYDLDTGRASAPEVFARDVDCSPDGLVVAADGTVWSAKWAGSSVVVYEPSGAVAGRIPLPVENVTSLVFGGPDLDVLYVTTAVDEPEGYGRRSERPDLAGRVLALENLGVHGQPVRRLVPASGPGGTTHPSSTHDGAAVGTETPRSDA